MDMALRDKVVLVTGASGGIGRALVQALLEDLSARGVARVGVITDPNAAEFYARLGATVVSEWSSVPAGRLLPVMEFRL